MEKKENETFESSVKKLELIISELESGELDLDKSISNPLYFTQSLATSGFIIPNWYFVSISDNLYK